MFIKNIKSVNLIRDGNRCVPEEFSNQNGFYFNRPCKNGKYGYSPAIRFCDLNIKGIPLSNEAYKAFDMWVRNPFLDVKTPQMFHIPTYKYEIHSPIDSFDKNKIVKLIALNSDKGDVVYDGNVSNVMFEAETDYSSYTTGNQERCTDECCNLKLIECGWGRYFNQEDMEYWTTMPDYYDLFPKDYIPDWWKDWPDRTGVPEFTTEWEEYYQFQIGNIVIQCRIHENVGNPDASKDTFGIMFRFVSTTLPINLYQQDEGETDNNICLYWHRVGDEDEEDYERCCPDCSIKWYAWDNEKTDYCCDKCNLNWNDLSNNLIEITKRYPMHYNPNNKTTEHEWVTLDDQVKKDQPYIVGYESEDDPVDFTNDKATRLFTIPILNNTSLGIYKGNPEFLPVEYFLQHGLDITIPSVKCTKISSTGTGPNIRWEAVPTDEPGIDFRLIVSLGHWWDILRNIDENRLRTHYVQHLKIINSNLRSFDTGSFKCSVLKDNEYKPVGGLITIDVNTNIQDLMDQPNQQWIRVPEEFATYRELPEEFILVPKIDIDKDIKLAFTFKTKYRSDVNQSISGDIRDPYRYYLDIKNHKKLPISNIRQNDHKRRLVIDQDINRNIKTVQTPYIGICRYSLQDIPKDGYINLTGYVPTPLNRERYEFWVNGRFLRDEVIILSPTTIILQNLKSLKNFEVIELVDDTDFEIDKKNKVMRQGMIYTDLEGNIWSDYRLALLSNSHVFKQDLKYMFNANQHQKIHDYVPNKMKTLPNNDWEINILDGIKFSEEDKKDYEKYHNIPTLNGIPLGHVYLSTIGIRDINQKDILTLYDHHWKKEAITNPLFPTTHRDGMETFLNSQLRIIVYAVHHEQQIEDRKIYTDSFGNILPFDFKVPTDDIVVTARGMTDRYFSLYITDEPDKEIFDKDHVKKIIPFIRTGVYVVINREQYRSMYISSTIPNTQFVRII